jgi:hypothetical protein
MDPIKDIIKFNTDRNLVKFSASAEYSMLFEELQEFLMGSARDNEKEMLDGLCDLIVVSVGAINKLGYDPHIALDETIKEITSRKGSFNKASGKWDKDPFQDVEELYIADYQKAKR